MMKKRKKPLNPKEKLFKRHYLKCFVSSRAAKEAGYSESVSKNQAWSWVSLTGCPENKVHLRDSIHKTMGKNIDDQGIDSAWVLKRAVILADFTLKKFVKTDENGHLIYDFSDATGDDWYCIEECLSERSYREIGGESVPVDKVRIKTASKVSALKLVGDHVKVGAFSNNVKIDGDIYIKIEQEDSEL